MRRLREIPCRMLARTAVQPRVLVALIIQCATMATEVFEVAEVANESEEDVVINCVTIFYEEGKEGENFRKKNKFRCKVNKTEKRVIKLTETVW